MDDRSAAEQIDDMIEQSGDWRGETLARLRALIKAARLAQQIQLTPLRH